MTGALVALVSALLWALIGAVGSARAPGAPGVAVSACAVFGCAALTLLPVAFAARGARPLGVGARSALLGAAVAAFPLCAFGALLFSKTHHRALGGVTFAIVAAGVVVVAALVARRALTAGAHVALRRGLVGAAVLSLIATLAWLLGAASAVPVASRTVLADGCVGGVLLAVTAFAPFPRLPVRAGRGVLAGCLLSALGLVLFALDAELARHLAERAPVATFVARLLL